MKGVEHIGDIIDKMMEAYRREPERELTEIWDVWEDIVGSVVAEHARPEAFKGKLLLVTVSNSTWMHHLQFMKKDILAKINDAYGKAVVDSIRFKIGSLL